MIGTDPQSGTLRWTMDTLYLWDGLPLVPLTLGIFALPELCDLAIGRMAVVQQGQTLDTKTGMLLGVKDCMEHWFLILRCSWIGSAMGAIPGIGASVIDWISYGHALRTEKGAAETFGTGDVRGVIAAESATNAREGGALVPTVAFGVPASAGMAILLGAFLIHGLVPGPEMLTKHLDLTYSMVWSIAIANILGSGLCFAFSGQLAKMATLRYTLFMPGVLSLIYIGAFEASRNWGDLFSLMFFGMLGWAMKHFKLAAAAVGARFHPRRSRSSATCSSRSSATALAGCFALRPRHVHHGGDCRCCGRCWRTFAATAACRGWSRNGAIRMFSFDNLFAAALLMPVHRDAVAIVRLVVRRPHHADHRRHRRDPVLLTGPDQRRVRPARARRRAASSPKSRKKSTWTSFPRPRTCPARSS